jgi:uncharacterized protein (TIGR02145 family)
VLANQSVTLRFTLHDESSDGTVLWTEQQSTVTNGMGLAVIQMGAVAPLLGIDWQHGAKYLQVELQTDVDFIELGTQQILSVPYALHAGQVDVQVSETGDTLWIGQDWIVVLGISVANAGRPTAHSCDVPDIHNSEVTYGEMTDQEGNAYRTVMIGGREWMAENLNTSIYRNGDALVTGLTAANWQSATSGAWQYYDQEAINECPHGKMYNWYAVNDTRGICPAGWHVPNEADWSTLEVALGGQLVAGNNMKTTSVSYWLGGNANATNESGFSALGSGFYYFYGSFEGLAQGVNFWSATSFDASSAWVRSITFDLPNLSLSIYPKNSGFHVRCVRD